MTSPWLVQTAEKAGALPRVCRYGGRNATAAIAIYERVRRDLVHTKAIGEVRLVHAGVVIARSERAFVARLPPQG